MDRKRGIKQASLVDQLEYEKSDEGRFIKRSRNKREKDKKPAEDFLDSKTSKQVLSQALMQREEELVKMKETEIDFANIKAEDFDDDQSVITDDMSETESTYMQDMHVDEEDEKLINLFMGASSSSNKVSDIIAQKMREEKNSGAEPDLKPEVVEVYQKVASMMRFLHTDKLPKAMKILPQLKNWEQLLFITRPDQWAPRAMLLMTRLFTVNSKEKMAQRFFSIVLLPAVREDIANTKHLNFQLYLALKKAMYKIAAWFKGILLPLCAAGDCSLREAVLISRVLKRNSIPPLHASVAILKIALLPYSPTNSHFLLIFLDKRYSLPYKVVDTLVEHFMGFRNETRTLPVLWHQCLLVFIRRYKDDLTTEQKGDLKDLLHIQHHPLISREIQSELLTSTKSRGEPTPQ